jgi:hypothetical protein
VLATGWGSAVDREAARTAGVGAVVGKPYLIDDLCSAIAEATGSVSRAA